MQAPDAACFIRDAICEPSHSTHGLHPHATRRANSAAAVGAGICPVLRHPRDPRASLSRTLTRKHHCFRPLRACSNAWRPSALTSLSQPARTGHGREASHVASYVGLCNVYWPCRESQTYQHTHHIAITAPCREQTPHDDNARLPLDTTCYTGTPHVTQRQPDRHRHPAKASCKMYPLLRTSDDARHLISRLRVSPHLVVWSPEPDIRHAAACCSQTAEHEWNYRMWPACRTSSWPIARNEEKPCM